MTVPTWGRRILSAASFLVVLTLTVLYLSLASRRYQSDAKLLVRMGRESITLDPTATTGQFVAMAESRDSEVHAVEELIASRAAAERIVETFGPGAILEEKKGRGGLRLSERLAWLDDYNLNPLRVYSVRDKAVKALQKNLGISAGKKSNVLSISYKAEDPQLAHDVLEALLQIAREEHVRIHRTKGSQEFFEAQCEQLRTNLAGLEQKLRDFKNENHLSTLSTQREVQLGLIGSLRGDLLRALAEHNAVQAEVELRRKQLRDQPAMMVTEQTTGQPQTARQTLREKLYELEVKEQELASRLKEDAPQLVQIRTQIAESRRIMAQEELSTQITKGVNQTHQAADLALQEREAQLVALKARTQSLDTKVAGVEGELMQLNAAELELTRLERDIDLVRTNYRKYSENLEQARIDHELEAAKISSMSLMQPPTLSATPISPQPLPTLAFGFALAIVASCGVAVWTDRRPRPRRRPAGGPSLEPPPAPTTVRPRRREPAVPANPR